MPDGSSLDAEGRLWTARVASGACPACIVPDGSLLDTIKLPCTWPTSCGFGGLDLSTLFVTSAQYHFCGGCALSSPDRRCYCGRPFRYRNGFIALPKGPGLGVEPERDKLAEYAEHSLAMAAMSLTAMRRGRTAIPSFRNAILLTPQRG
jgi:SMP-30/Gluconolactonase/LRE-like region